MKTKFLLIASLICLFGFNTACNDSCNDSNINTKDENNLLQDENSQKAKVYFYTNLHTVVNCPNVVVKLYVDDKYIGDLTGGVPFETDIDGLEKLSADTNNPYTIFIVYETDVPKSIKYRTEGKCYDTNLPNFYGEVTINKDSSCMVFLDLFKE